MKNPAPAEFPIHDLIRDRWSPRAFGDQDIAPETLRSLFEAARWAPSSSNEQPWSFLVATRSDPENFNKALQPLVEFNVGWAKHAAANDNDPDKPHHLRVEITEGGRRVVNLRVPLNMASLAAGFVPGLPDDTAERVRSAIRAGERGPIVDITTDDGDRVLIVNE